MPTTNRTAFRLLATDLDGTLVDPEGHLQPRTRKALAAARHRGVKVVACTGRRWRTAKPLLDALELEGPVVVQNGTVVKDARSGQTLRHRYFPDRLYQPVLNLTHRFGSPLVYIDSPDGTVDIVCKQGGSQHFFQREYIEKNRDFVRQVASLDTPPEEPVVMMSWMADGELLESLAEFAHQEIGSGVYTHLIQNKMYRGDILEILSPLANKWNAVYDIAKSLGIGAHEIVAMGDDDNDLPMIRGAGLGIAMANAKPSLLAEADFVTASNAKDGAALAIERFFLTSA